MVPKRSEYEEANMDDLGLLSQTRRKRHPNRLESVIAACTLFLVGFAAGGVMVVAIMFQRNHSEVVPSQNLELGAVIPKDIVSRKVPVVFEPDIRYYGFSKEATHNWQQLVASHELVWLPEASKEHPEGGYQAFFWHEGRREAPSHFYRVSNLHQIHCVNYMRSRYIDMLHNTTPSAFDPNDLNAHMEHCVEYLRLSITCGETLGIEGSSPPGTPAELVADPWGNPLGWGTTRNCIDWEALMRWQRDQETIYNRTWVT